MKRILIIGTLAVAIVAALGLMAFSFADAASGFDRPFAHGIEGPRFEGDRPDRGALQPYLEEATADILGISVQELQEARENRTRMSELIEAAGLTPEEFKAAIEAALPDALDQAVADEVITREQADAILENGLRGPGRRGYGPLNPYVLEVSADILGMEVEGLQQALQDGTPMSELLDEAGITHLEFRMAVDEATPDMVQQALDDGAITDEQAEKILEFGLWPPRCRDGRGGGPGHGGPRGEFGPEGPGFDAPAFEG